MLPLPPPFRVSHRAETWRSSQKRSRRRTNGRRDRRCAPARAASPASGPRTYSRSGDTSRIGAAHGSTRRRLQRRRPLNRLRGSDPGLQLAETWRLLLYLSVGRPRPSVLDGLPIAPSRFPIFSFRAVQGRGPCRDQSHHALNLNLSTCWGRPCLASDRFRGALA